MAIGQVLATYDRRDEATIIVSQDWDSGLRCALRKRDRQGTGVEAGSRVLPLVDPGSFLRRGIPDRIWVPRDLRRLLRFERLRSEEAIDGPSSEGEGCG